MKFVALNTSIVVLAEAHNPTILHPSFLSAQGIVPTEWQLAEPPMCTPAISVVKYANQVVFTAELNKLMVRDNAPKEDTSVAILAVKYLEALPHVPYSAVGVNFSGYAECSTPETWLLDRFLKPGPGNDAKMFPNAIALKLVYQISDSVLNLTCDPGSVQKPLDQSPTPCLLINGNYHAAVPADHSLDGARSALKLFPTRIAHFKQTIQTVFGLET